MIERLSTVLPDPDSPTTPSDLPRFERARHAVDGTNEPAFGPEVGPQVVDFEQRAVGLGTTRPVRGIVAFTGDLPHVEVAAQIGRRRS